MSVHCYEQHGETRNLPENSNLTENMVNPLIFVSYLLFSGNAKWRASVQDFIFNGLSSTLDAQSCAERTQFVYLGTPLVFYAVRTICLHKRWEKTRLSNIIECLILVPKPWSKLEFLHACLQHCHKMKCKIYKKWKLIQKMQHVKFQHVLQKRTSSTSVLGIGLKNQTSVILIWSESAYSVTSSLNQWEIWLRPAVLTLKSDDRES